MKKIITIPLLAMVVSATPIAIAGPQSASEPQGYEIAFSGAVLPSAADRIGYPYSAASNNISGSCSLSVLTNDMNEIVDMHVVSCSDARFAREAERWIEAQDLTVQSNSTLKAHPLSVNWQMDALTPAQPVYTGIEFAAN